MMISMKTNSRGKLPVPPPKFQGSVSAPTLKAADDLSIPAFLDAKKTESAKSTAAKAKGPLSQIAAAIKDGKEPPKSALKTTTPAAKEKTVTKTAAKKAPAKAAAKATKTVAKGGVGATAMAAIVAGKTDEQALALVMKAHPECTSNINCMRWYRNKLRKDGKIKRPTKARAAA